YGMLNHRASAVESKNTAQGPRRCSVEKSAQAFENVQQRASGSHHFEQLLLSGHKSFSPLSVCDIGADTDPFDDLSCRVVHRRIAGKEPAIRSIKPSQSAFTFARLTRGHNRPPPFSYFRQVFRRHDRQPSPTEGLIHAETGVFEPPLVVEVDV